MSTTSTAAEASSAPSTSYPPGPRRVSLLDYGAGNVRSVRYACACMCRVSLCTIIFVVPSTGLARAFAFVLYTFRFIYVYIYIYTHTGMRSWRWVMKCTTSPRKCIDRESLLCHLIPSLFPSHIYTDICTYTHNSPEEIATAETIVFPGVGSFGSAMEVSVCICMCVSIHMHL